MSPPKNRFKALFEDTALCATPCPKATSLSEETNAELSSIRAASVTYEKTNGFDFWTAPGIEVKYPILAEMAQDLISAPASQAYVERVFSVCGDLTHGKRNRLTKNLELRAFVKMNKKYY